MSIPVSITDFLKSRGVTFTPLTHRPAFTAQEEAAVAHVPGREWAKTVVCFADNEPILAVLPAHLNVDLEQLRRVAGCKTIRLAEEGEIVGMYPECETGAMPPLGPLFSQRVFVDQSLTSDPEVVFNAGTHTDALRLKYLDWAALVKPTVAEFGRAPRRPPA